MKATEASLLKFLRKSPQFVIPIYQRNYSWTAVQCRQLWFARTDELPYVMSLIRQAFDYQMGETN
jgi:hypothetical protein